MSVDVSSETLYAAMTPAPLAVTSETLYAAMLPPGQVQVSSETLYAALLATVTATRRRQPGIIT